MKTKKLDDSMPGIFNRIVAHINSNMTVTNLVSEYLKDPNCRPELWISSEKYLTDEQRKIFFELVAYYQK